MRSHMELVKAFNNNEVFVPRYKEILNIQKDYLELYIEESGELSSFLHDFPFGQEDIKGVRNEFRIKGPFVFRS